MLYNSISSTTMLVNHHRTSAGSRNARRCAALLLFMMFGFGPTLLAQGNKMEIHGRDTIQIDVQPDAEELKILKELFTGTNGKGWRNKANWLIGSTSADMARWYGITVANGDVVSIHLDKNNLTGQVPASVYQLRRLQSISYTGNALSTTHVSSTTLTAAAPVTSTTTARSASIASAGNPQPMAIQPTTGKIYPCGD